MKFFDFGAFQKIMKMLSHDKILFHILFVAFHNSSCIRTTQFDTKVSYKRVPVLTTFIVMQLPCECYLYANKIFFRHKLCFITFFYIEIIYSSHSVFFGLLTLFIFGSITGGPVGFLSPKKSLRRGKFWMVSRNAIEIGIR